MCTALAATVGTGNIAGVAGAIAIGGPGAVFCMRISALLGMCTKISKVVLAVHFRETNADGELVGGPMYYVINCLGKHWQWVGILYCVLKDKTANDGHTDVFVRAEDASNINRIFDRFGIATADIGSARTEIVKAKEEQ